MNTSESKKTMFLQDTAVGDLTRGGQLILHFLRMLGQVVKKFLGAMIVGYLGLAILLSYWWTDDYDRYLGWKSLGAYVAVSLHNADKSTEIETQDHRVI